MGIQNLNFLLSVVYVEWRVVHVMTCSTLLYMEYLALYELNLSSRWLVEDAAIGMFPAVFGEMARRFVSDTGEGGHCSCGGLISTAS